MIYEKLICESLENLYSRHFLHIAVEIINF